MTKQTAACGFATSNSAIPNSKHHRPRPGFILILVLVVIALLTLASFTYMRMMLTGRKASHLSGRQAQARLLADSGIEAARLFLAKDQETRGQLGGSYNNPAVFQMQSVVDDGQGGDPGRFTFVSPDQVDGRYQGIRFGLEDDSNRLNINVLMELEKRTPGVAKPVLMGLPGMTDDVADAVLDWMDEDEELRDFGAESQYYTELGYEPKNGPLDSIEELLLVRGVTPWLLFGADANRNGSLGAGEPDGQNLDMNVDNSDGSMNGGWSAYLTLYSMESNVTPEGKPRIDLNGSDMEKLFEQLEDAISTEAATFIVAYRQNGPYNGDGEPVNAAGTLDFEQKPKTTFKTVLDLIGQNTQVKFQSDDKATILQTPFSDTPGATKLYLPILMDHCTVNPSELIPGRININQAPRIVLLGIPGLSQEAVDNIVAQRQPDPINRDESHRHETWILDDGYVTLEEMKSLMPFVGAGGCVHRAQVVGYFDRGGPAVRIETVLDASQQPAAILFYRDLSHLGRGYALGTLGVADLTTP